MDTHPRYEEWIEAIFDHPVTDPEWYWSDDQTFEADPTDIVTLIEQTFTHAGRDLGRFSAAQVNQGLWYLSFQTCSDYLEALKDPRVPIARRLEAIRSIYLLYRDCFQARCSHILSHLGQNGSPLNNICYMFWDLNGLRNLEGLKDGAVLADCIFAVLARTLELPHISCQEAAIHGYGELAVFFPERVQSTIEEVLAKDQLVPALRDYARSAGAGMLL